MTTEPKRPLDLAALIDQLLDLTAVAIEEEARWMPDLPPDGHEVYLPAPLPLMLDALRALEAWSDERQRLVGALDALDALPERHPQLDEALKVLRRALADVGEPGSLAARLQQD